MSTVTLRKWGNSMGIRIPAEILVNTKAYEGEKFELFVKPAGELVLRPIKNAQSGWLEAFNAAADAGDDKLIIQDIKSDFDKDEWTW